MTRSARLCVVLGAPRSGTTWLQRLLASSPHVATPQETHLFEQYLRPQWQRWRWHAAQLERTLSNLSGTDAVDSRVIGLPTILDDDDLLSGQIVLVERLISRALAAKPEAQVVLEKTPSNSLCVELIDRVCPEAQFIHIVRDPREVMASLRDVTASWANWAPQSANDAARTWLNHFQCAREAAAFGPERYLEIRYDDLRSNPKDTLAEVLEFLGLHDDAGALVEAAESSEAGSFDTVFAFRPEIAARLRDLPGTEPPGFRSGGRRPLGRLALTSAENVLGPTAREAGYTTGWPARSGATRSAFTLALRLQDIQFRVRRLAHRRRTRAW